MKIRLFSVVLVIILGILVSSLVVSNYAAIENEYNTNLANARANAEKLIPYNAYNYYKAAFDIRCEDENIYLEFLEQAKALGESYYGAAIKDYVVKNFYKRVQDRNSSAGLTNMGTLQVPKEMLPHIHRFDIYMGIPYSSRTNCAIISYNNILTINFASCIKETAVEKYFFQKLVEDGVKVTIESNRMNEKI